LFRFQRVTFEDGSRKLRNEVTKSRKAGSEDRTKQED